MRATRTSAAAVLLVLAACGDGLLGAVNEPPLAVAGPDRTGAPGETLAFSAAGSTDPDGTIVRYAWTFGDGATAEGESVSHAYAAPGLYEVTLVVTDDRQATARDTVYVEIVESNEPPVAEIAGPNEVRAGEAFTLDSAGSRDPDGVIVARRWTLPDGSTRTEEAITVTLHDPGVATFTLEVTDDRGATDRVEHAVRVREAAVEPPAHSVWDWGLVNPADVSDPKCGPFQAAPLDVTLDVANGRISIREAGGSGGSTPYSGTYTAATRRFSATHPITAGSETIDATFAPDFRTFTGTYTVQVSLLGCNRTRNVHGTRR